MNYEDMETLIFLAVLGSIFLGWMLIYYGLTARSRKKLKEQWQQLAYELQLQYKSIGSLYGFIDGYQVRTNHRLLTESSSSHTDTEVIYTQIIMSTNTDMPDGLKICGNELFLTFLKLFGAKDIVVGIPSLDDPLIIKGNDPELVTQLFHRLEQRDALLSLCSSETPRISSWETLPSSMDWERRSARSGVVCSELAPPA